MKYPPGMQPPSPHLTFPHSALPLGAGGPLVFNRGPTPSMVRVNNIVFSSDYLHQRGGPAIHGHDNGMRPQEFLQPVGELSRKTFDNQWNSKINRSSADVGYAGGGGSSRPATLAHQYLPAASVAHPTSNSSNPQPNPQNQQIRGQSGQLPPPHLNTHVSVAGPPPPHSHSQQHHSHPLSAISQQPHPGLSTVSVSGGHSGAAIVQSVQQPIVTHGQSSSVGHSHELNAQGIQQTAQSIQQVSPVALASSVAGQHSMMYNTNNPNAHPQSVQSNNQYMAIPQPNATHMHNAGQQNRHHPSILHHQNMQHFPYSQLQVMPPQSPHVYQFINQQRSAVVPPPPPQYQQYPAVYSVPAQPYYQQTQPTPPAKAPPASSAPRERTKNAIPIIDPATNKEIDMENVSTGTTPKPSLTPTQSRDSSASNTPAPGETLPIDKPHSSDIQALFALQVAREVGKESETSNSGDYIYINKQGETSPIDKPRSTDIQALFALQVAREVGKESETSNSGDYTQAPYSIQRFVNSVSVRTENNSSIVQQCIGSETAELAINQSVKASHAPQIPPQAVVEAVSCPPPQPQRPPKQSRNQPASVPAPVSQPKPSPPVQDGQQAQTKHQSHGKPQSQNKGNVVAPIPKNQGTQSGSATHHKNPSTVAPQGQPQKSSPAVNQVPPQQHMGKQADIPNASRATHEVYKAQVQHATHVQVQQPQPPPHIQPHSLKRSGFQEIQTAPQAKPAHADSLTKSSAAPNASHSVPQRSSVEPASQPKTTNEKMQPSAVTQHISPASSRKETQGKAASKTETVSSKKDAANHETGTTKRGGKEKKSDVADDSKASKEGSAKVPPGDSVKGPVDAPQVTNKGSQSKQKSAPEKPVQSTTPSSTAAPIVPSTPSASQQKSSSQPSNEAVSRSRQETAPSIPVPSQDPKTAVTEKVAESTPETNHIADKPKSSSLTSDINKQEVAPAADIGKRHYDRDFLLHLQSSPLAKQKPDSLPDIDIVLNAPARSSEIRPRVLSDFTPAFIQTANNNNRSRGSPYQPKMPGGRGSQPGKKLPRVIDIKLPSSVEVKLKTTENAWKPSLKVEKDVSEDQLKHDKTIKKMRGILNKLTPDNFSKLVVQVKAFNVEKIETFDELIGIVFEKALDEQAFSSTYAELCKVLSQMSVKTQTGDDEAKFRNLLISKCQAEFEKDSAKALQRDQREQAIAQKTDTDKKLELVAQLQFDEQQLRRRSVGNIRFIGELYKRKMLTSPIMMRIIEGLLKKKDEESLECLCKLLTTIGKMIEESAKTSQWAQEELNQVFNQMKNMVDKKTTSSRVRFLMMDVVDLRVNNWVPRREEGNPKTKAQVHEEIRKEEIKQQHMLTMAGYSNNSYGDRDKKRGFRDDPMSNTISINTRRANFDSSRLKNNTFTRHSNIDNNVVLRPGLSNWTQGSSGGSGGGSGRPKEEDESIRLSNRFMALENPTADNRRPSPMVPRLAPGGNNNPQRPGVTSFGSKSMPPPMEKSSIKFMGVMGDRSKPNSRSSSRDSSMVRSTPPLESVPNVENAMKCIVEEYAMNQDLKEATLCIQEKFPEEKVRCFVESVFEYMLDRDAGKRKSIGILLHHLVVNELLSVSQICQGSKMTMEMMPDYVIDIPKVYSNVAEVLARLITPNVVKLADILNIIQPADTGIVPIFSNTLRESFKHLEKSAVIDMWKESGLSWDRIGTPGDVSKHLEDLEFTMDGQSSSISKSQSLNSDYVRMELAKMFASKMSDDQIHQWIDVNVGQNTTSKDFFIRALTSALIESSLDISPKKVTAPSNFLEEKLSSRSTFMKKYVDNKAERELQCIYAIQALVVQYEHPNRLLDRCFNAFYNNEVLSDEAFFDWENSDDPEELLGKGVCLTSGKHFLKWLREPEAEQDP